MQITEPVFIAAILTFSITILASLVFMSWLARQLISREREHDNALVTAEQRSEKRVTNVYQGGLESVTAMSRALDSQTTAYRAEFDKFTAKFNQLSSGVDRVADGVASHNSWAREDASKRDKTLEALREGVDASNASVAKIENLVSGLENSINAIPGKINAHMDDMHKKIVEQVAGEIREQVSEIKDAIHLMRVVYAPPEAKEEVKAN